jgi:hypothetical protein
MQGATTRSSTHADAAASAREHRAAISPIRSLLELFSMQHLALPREPALEMTMEIHSAECPAASSVGDMVPDLVPDTAMRVLATSLVPEALHSDQLSEVEEVD